MKKTNELTYDSGTASNIERAPDSFWEGSTVEVAVIAQQEDMMDHVQAILLYLVVRHRVFASMIGMVSPAVLIPAKVDDL